MVLSCERVLDLLVMIGTTESIKDGVDMDGITDIFDEFQIQPTLSTEHLKSLFRKFYISDSDIIL